MGIIGTLVELKYALGTIECAYYRLNMTPIETHDAQFSTYYETDFSLPTTIKHTVFPFPLKIYCLKKGTRGVLTREKKLIEL
jgi:hypothetical protein